MKSKQTIAAIFGFVLLAGTIVLAWLLFSAALVWFKELNATIAAALTTAVLGLVGLWYAQWHSKSRDIAAVRSRFIAPFSTWLRNSNTET